MRHPRTVALATCALGLAGLVPVAVSAGAAHRATVHRVTVGDDFYSPMKLTIARGEQVEWVWSSHNYESHNVTLIKGPKGVAKQRFTSRDGVTRMHFTRTFDTPGTYLFECTVHPSMDIAVTVKR